MATSRFETETLSAPSFVESAGTVLFRLSTREVCVLRLLQRNEYILPKGRRRVGESRAAAATRETTEETGFPCRLLPVDMRSRACPVLETDHVPDEARFYAGICEPIAVQLRHLGQGDAKLIWWYVAAVDEGEPVNPHEADKFEVEFHSYGAVLQKLTFGDDRRLVEEAMELVASTLGPQ